MGAMYDFCKIMYGWMPGFDIDFYVKLGDVVLTRAGYKDITGKDYVAASSAAATDSGSANAAQSANTTISQS